MFYLLQSTITNFFAVFVPKQFFKSCPRQEPLFAIQISLPVFLAKPFFNKA
jgi:hypothetical protein